MLYYNLDVITLSCPYLVIFILKGWEVSELGDTNATSLEIDIFEDFNFC